MLDVDIQSVVEDYIIEELSKTHSSKIVKNFIKNMEDDILDDEILESIEDLGVLVISRIEKFYDEIGNNDEDADF